MTEGVFDLIIIGIGPAGYSAAIYAARKQMSVLVIGDQPGGQAAETWEVENYLGFSLLTGPELVQRFEEHVKEFDIEMMSGRRVSKVSRDGDVFVVASEEKGADGSREDRAMSVIVASGKEARKLDVPGEAEYKNRGVTYCSTCDAPLFKGKVVAMVGGGNSALEGALQLTKIAKKTHLINIEAELTGDEVLREKVGKSEVIEIHNNAKTLAIVGERTVTGLDIENTESGEKGHIDLDGVLIEIGTIPSSDFVADVVELNQVGEIKVDIKNKTNIGGLFAAGDVTDVPEKQIVIAAGEGAKAALSAYEYLVKRKEG